MIRLRIEKEAAQTDHEKGPEPGTKKEAITGPEKYRSSGTENRTGKKDQ